MKERIDNLTGIRAFAALWVVVYHFNHDPLVGGRLGPIVAHGYLGVDMFFVLSGFVLSLVYAPRLPERLNASWYKQFLARRFAKIYPIHLLTFLATVALVLVSRHVGYKSASATANTPFTAALQVLLLNAFGITSDQGWNLPSWSVSAEWFAYTLLFAPMVYLLRQIKTAYVALAAAIVWGSFLLLCALVLHSGIDLTSNGVLRIAPEFLSGYLLYRLVQVRRPRYGDLWVIAGLLVLVAVTLGGAATTWLLMPAVLAMFAGLYVGGPVSNRIFGNRLAVLLGDASYSIYLIQLFILIAGNQVLRRAHLHMGFAKLCIAAAVEVVTVALCGWLTFRYIEEPLRQRVLRVLHAQSRNPERAPQPTMPPFAAADTQTSSTIG